MLYARPHFYGKSIGLCDCGRIYPFIIGKPLAAKYSAIESSLKQQLSPLAEKDYVKEVRVLGAIGVVEMKSAVNMKTLVPRFVEQGVWIRPFGNWFM